MERSVREEGQRQQGRDSRAMFTGGACGFGPVPGMGVGGSLRRAALLSTWACTWVWTAVVTPPPAGHPQLPRSSCFSPSLCDGICSRV